MTNTEKSNVFLLVLSSFIVTVTFFLMYFLTFKINPPEKFKPTITPTPPIDFQTYISQEYNFSFDYPQSWANNPNIASEIGDLIYITSPNGSILRVNIFLDGSKTISDYLVKKDNIASTAYEGKPSLIVKSTQKTIIAGLNCIQRVETIAAAGFDVISTYFKSGGSIYQISLMPGLNGILVQTDIDAYQQILSTFELTNSAITWEQRGIPVVRGELTHYTSSDGCVALVVDQPIETTKTLEQYVRQYTSVWSANSLDANQTTVGNYPSITLPGLNAEEISNTFTKIGNLVYKITAMLISNAGPPSCKLDYSPVITAKLKTISF